MSAGSKLSSGELASLAALLIAVAVIAAVLLGRKIRRLSLLKSATA